MRVRGSHHKYGKGSARIIVPIHGNQSLKIGIQRALMRNAGLTEEDL